VGALAGAALALSGLGCDTWKGEANPQMPLWVHHPGGALTVSQRRTLTDPGRVSGEAYERGKPAIDVPHRRVFVGSTDHGLYALNAQNLDVLWRFETMAAVQCEPLYDPEEDVVYFGSGDGALYKVRAAHGELVWRFASNGEVARKPAIDGDVVYITNANDTLIAIDRKTGKLKWHQHRTPAFGIEIGGYAGPTVGNGKVYTAFSDGIAMAYSTIDGSEQWPVVDLAVAATGGDGQPPQYLDIDTTPVLATAKGESVAIVASYEGGVFALDAENGHEVWRNSDVRGVSDLLLWEQPDPPADKKVAGVRLKARKVLVASSGPTGLWGLDVETGKELWRQKLPEGGMTAPAAVQGALLVGTTRYGIFLFHPLDGGVIDGIQPGNEVAMSPVAYGSKAFVMTNGGQMLGLVVSPPR
jgi:outer membrane protein assembly factor BamB